MVASGGDGVGVCEISAYWVRGLFQSNENILEVDKPGTLSEH